MQTELAKQGARSLVGREGRNPRRERLLAKTGLQREGGRIGLPMFRLKKRTREVVPRARLQQSSLRSKGVFRLSKGLDLTQSVGRQLEPPDAFPECFEGLVLDARLDGLDGLRDLRPKLADLCDALRLGIGRTRAKEGSQNESSPPHGPASMVYANFRRKERMRCRSTRLAEPVQVGRTSMGEVRRNRGGPSALRIGCGRAPA